MGCGDWNDGMNLVGAGGKGESVWVAWFQILVRTAVRRRGRSARRRRTGGPACGRRPTSSAAAVEEHAWDGEWYLRAWFDDGTPLGSTSNDECRIDSLPQSWAVLSGVGDPDRAGARPWTPRCDAPGRSRGPAGQAVRRRRSTSGPLQPGYIKGYVPGIRENGGQYTHAAIWLVQALAGLGRGGEAHALWQMLSPISHADTPGRRGPLQGRAVRRGGGRVRRAAARRPRRLDVVHRVGRVAVPGGRRDAARARRAAATRSPSTRASRPTGRTSRSSTATAGASTAAASRTRTGWKKV